MTVPFQAESRSLSRALNYFHVGEDLLAIFALTAMVLLPLAELLIRPFFVGGIPGSIPFVEHLTLWVGFLGAGIAARQNKLISLATASFIPDGVFRKRDTLPSPTGVKRCCRRH